MQPGIVILPLVDQFDQSREGALFVHHLEGDFIVAAVKEEQCDDEMEGVGRVFLDMYHQSGPSGWMSTCPPPEDCR